MKIFTGVQRFILLILLSSLSVTHLQGSSYAKTIELQHGPLKISIAKNPNGLQEHLVSFQLESNTMPYDMVCIFFSACLSLFKDRLITSIAPNGGSPTLNIFLETASYLSFLIGTSILIYNRLAPAGGKINFTTTSEVLSEPSLPTIEEQINKFSDKNVALLYPTLESPVELPSTALTTSPSKENYKKTTQDEENPINHNEDFTTQEPTNISE